MDKWLSNPNVVKVVAFVIGILLWVVVSLEEGTSPGMSPISEVEEKIYNVSITPKYDENKLFIQSIEPAEVMISLRGKESALRKVTSGSYKVELDLTSVGKGEFILPLKPVDFPANVRVEMIPQSVKVNVEEQKKKEMPVVVTVVGNPAEDLRAGQPIVNPNRVHVTMPSSRLDEVALVKAEVNIDQARSAIVRKVKLVAYSQEGHEIEANISPAVIDVEVPITSPFKSIPLQLKLINEPPPNFSVSSLEQKVYQVTVYGQQQVLDQLDYYEGPVIDLSEFTESSDLTLNLDLSPNINKIEPSKVDVHLEIVPSVRKQLYEVPVTIIGQNDDFNLAFLSPGNGKFTLNLEGAPTLIDQINVQNIQAFIDVSNLPPGEHDVKLNVNLPTFIKNITPQQWVKIEISAKLEETD